MEQWAFSKNLRSKRGSTMSETVELKRCPFCGADGKLVKSGMWQGRHGYFGVYSYSYLILGKICSILRLRCEK